MIDIVIPLRNDSTWNNNEIRYCLRSVEKNLTGIRNVYIIGYKPKFIQNVIHIPMNDPSPFVTVNIKNKILRACQEEALSDEFLFMNDDHYILPSFDMSRLYWSELLMKEWEFAKNSIYRIIINNTINHLGGIGSLAICFDTHTPIMYHKKIFHAVMNKIDWSVDFGYLIKSQYVHRGVSEESIMNLKTLVPDGKIRDAKTNRLTIKELAERTPVLSSGQYVGVGMIQVLNELFPEKSKYEI